MEITLDRHIYRINRLPDLCPYCHKHLIPEIISGMQEKGIMDLFLKCTNFNCCQTFIGKYNEDNHSRYILDRLIGGSIKKREFDKIINDISEMFSEIYNQAQIAEVSGLNQICGVGYRKALEFLIKDYAIKLKPEDEPKIKSILLTPVINNYITSENIKNVAKRASWLGNDETHYERKWEGKDVQSLKKLIDLTISWIETEENTRLILEEMPD